MLKILPNFYLDEITFLDIYVRIIWSLLNMLESFLDKLIYIVDMLYTLIESSFRTKSFIWYFIWVSLCKWTLELLNMIIILVFFAFMPCHLLFHNLSCVAYAKGFRLWLYIHYHYLWIILIFMKALLYAIKVHFFIFLIFVSICRYIQFSWLVYLALFDFYITIPLLLDLDEIHIVYIMKLLLVN